jgi:hypothetical protein
MQLECRHCGQELAEMEVGGRMVDYCVPGSETDDDPYGMDCTENPEGPHEP